MKIKLTPSKSEYRAVVFDTDKLPLDFNAQNGTVHVERVDQDTKVTRPTVRPKRAVQHAKGCHAG